MEGRLPTAGLFWLMADGALYGELLLTTNLDELQADLS
jgi:hypothetical protein